MASTDDDDALAVVGLLLAVKSSESKVKRKLWTKDWLQKRKVYSHVNLLKELKFSPKDWHNYLRMDEDTYLRLLSLVAPIIKKKDTLMRAAISPHERLSATLRFMATGRSYEDLKFSTAISPQTLSLIVPETCKAIYKVLHKDYLKFPSTSEDWKSVAKDFEGKWNFPHCLGSIDGKHVNIIPPNGSGSRYYNYKGQHSLVLMAILDANYKFMLCDFGTNGRISDGGVLQNTSFFEKLELHELNIPAEETVRNAATVLPYVFVADDAFPLRQDMLKPFRLADTTTDDRKIFNYRTSRARRIVENEFGILASRFRIFHTAINLELQNIDSVVMACCCLHNFLLQYVPNRYAPPECFDRENSDEGTVTTGFGTGGCIERLERRNCGNTTRTAKEIREAFMAYFTNEGAVPWQINYINGN